MNILLKPFYGQTYKKFLKRFLDIVLSLILIILFLPLALIIAILIKLDSFGPIFADVPERVGENGKKFKMYKFRSMIVNAHYLLRTNKRFKKLYEEYKRGNYKLKDDPRVTKIGRLIRKHSLDEIPQLFNVLKGEMSLVGPRAYYPDELYYQQKKFPHTKSLFKKVLLVKPGITGLWQVSGRSDLDFEKRIALDFSYVDNLSLVNDLKIILKTPWVMITGKGAV
jgi:lipopolysaccharide/colanic/teichoic acid biosynthesis glycosyltransferase